jgi:hypothetical protein
LTVTDSIKQGVRIDLAELINKALNNENWFLFTDSFYTVGFYKSNWYWNLKYSWLFSIP